MEFSKFVPSECLDCGLEITKEIDAYLESRDKEHADKLNQELRYAHIWIPPEKRCQYHEDRKVHVSINTAAIKHIIFAAALRTPEAFREKENHELVLQLMVLVFNTLGDPTQFSCPHAFLKGVRIPHVSILPSQASNKVALALSIKEQCRMVVSMAMTQVSHICHCFYCFYILPLDFGINLTLTKGIEHFYGT